MHVVNCALTSSTASSMSADVLLVVLSKRQGHDRSQAHCAMIPIASISSGLTLCTHACGACA